MALRGLAHSNALMEGSTMSMRNHFDAVILIKKDHANSKVNGKKKNGPSLNLGILWICLFCAVLLDIIGLIKGLGFDPSFQLEAQPFFFAGIAATIFFTILRAKIGPLLAGVIFWIPLIVLAADLLLKGNIIPFGGDIAGIAELITAIVGIVAAHKTYHKFQVFFR
ncbi:MAG: hypothetical protein ACYC7D_07520 [Nitrososphaerales archaeon]